jgi:hypothetical protein
MDEALVKRRLMSRAAAVSGRIYDRLFQNDILEKMCDPQFVNRVKQHDWRNYIDEEIQQIWNSLSESARLALFITANKQAGKEEWD